MRPLRIVHLAGTPEGAPWLIAILREQCRRGCDVSAVLSGGFGTIARILTSEGIPVQFLDLDLPSSTTALHAFSKIRRASRLLRALRADVVHYHLYGSILMGRLAAWLADAPLRFSMIPGTFYLEAPILGDLEAGTAWADTRVIATCEKTRELYIERGTPASRMEVIYYGLDEDRFDPAATSGDTVRRELGIGDDVPVVGLVAHFYPPLRNAFLTPPHLLDRGVKGHDVLFRAIPLVLKECPAAKFLLVGRGWGPEGEAYEQRLRATALALGIDRAVLFTGERNDVPAMLAMFDVALQVSLCENLGGSIEALMMGRPLIATRVGGLVDSVKHGQTGLLVPPNDPEALADAIIRLLKDRDLAERLGSNGRRFMLERFTVRRTVDDLEELYARCGAARAHGYRLTRTLVRLPQLPFRVGGLMAKLEIARARNITRPWLLTRLRNFPGRILRRLRAAFA
ncbi:MAG: glycosyltransferase family 4 protein [Acidobacteriota bacterium]